MYYGPFYHIFGWFAAHLARHEKNWPHYASHSAPMTHSVATGSCVRRESMHGAVCAEHTYTLLTAGDDASSATSQWASFNGSNWSVQSLQPAVPFPYTLVPSLLPPPSPVYTVCHGFLAHQSIHGGIGSTSTWDRDIPPLLRCFTGVTAGYF